MDKFINILKEIGIEPHQLYLNSAGYNNGIYESIESVSKYVPQGKILDFGCGSGFTTYLLQNRGYIVKSIDCSNSESIELFKQKPELQKQLWKRINNNIQLYDGIKLPYEDNSFDGIFMHAVYEHLENIDIMKEIYRVLKNNGYLFIFRTPDKNSWAEKITGGHKDLITKSNLLEMIQQYKFTLVEFKKTDFLCWALPGKLQHLWNFMFPILNTIDKILLKTNLQKYAHNFKVIVKKD